MIITIYSDNGHAWGKVKKALLDRLGIAKDISPYSFMRDDYAYLEEDSDLPRLCSALREQGKAVSFNERVAKYNQSKIRQYEEYKAWWVTI